MKAVRLVVAMAVVAALGVALSGAAWAVPFSSGTSGSWNTRGHNTNIATWGAGTGAGGLTGAGVNVPWGTPGGPTDDTGEVNAGHTVGLDKQGSWSGTGADWPSTLTIILNGGTIAYEGGGVGQAKVASPIRVKADSSISVRDPSGNGASILSGNVSDYDGANTGALTILGGHPSRLNYLGLRSTDNSGFSGGWKIQGNANNYMTTVQLFWPSGNASVTGNKVFGTGDLEFDNGGFSCYHNVGSLPNNIVVGAGGARIETNSGGGLGAGSATLLGQVTGLGMLDLQCENSIVVVNAANSYASLQKRSNGTATFMSPGSLGGGSLSVIGGKLFLDNAGGVDWGFVGTDLTINGGVVEYDAIVRNTTVGALTLGATAFGPGVYDITAINGGTDFSTYFDGVGTVTVGSPGGVPIPEPVFLSVVGLSLLGLRRRR